MSWLRRGGKILGGTAVCGVCFVAGVGVGVLPQAPPVPSTAPAPPAPAPVQVPVEVPVPVVSERVVEKRVEVPVEIVSEKVIVKYDLPQTCATMVTALADATKASGDVSEETSKVLPIIDTAVRDINDKNFKALNDAIQSLRAIKDDAGTKQINLALAEDQFLARLETCRKEIEAR